MREILFRGKRILDGFPEPLSDGKWVYGYYTKYSAPYSNGTSVIEDAETDYMVIPETVGQFVSEYDSNGTKIFEGDILKYYDSGEEYSGLLVVTYYGGFGAKNGLIRYRPHKHRSYVEVVGNVHDNPELLGEVGMEHLKVYEFGNFPKDYIKRQYRIADEYGISLDHSGCYLCNYESKYVCHEFNGGCKHANSCERIFQQEHHKKNHSNIILE